MIHIAVIIVVTGDIKNCPKMTGRARGRSRSVARGQETAVPGAVRYFTCKFNCCLFDCCAVITGFQINTTFLLLIHMCDIVRVKNMRLFTEVVKDFYVNNN